MTMKIVAIVGSLRRDSYNLQLAKTIQERYKDKFHLDIADIRVLPYFNEDDEQHPPTVVNTFKRQIAETDGVLIVTPEYNWSVPGVLKNALDWLSRGERVLMNKPMMTAGVSPVTFGTVRAQLHLRQILSAPGISARVLPPGGNEILVNFAKQKFDAGRLTDESTLTFIDEVMQKFIDWIQQNK